MENQKINLNKLANSNNNSNSRNNTYFNQSQEIQPQFGETQIHPKIAADSIFCYNSSFWSNSSNNNILAIQSKL